MMAMTTDTTTISKKTKYSILLLDLSIILFTVLGGKLVYLMKKYSPVCFFRANGITCPSCGGTRCVENILSGNLSAAFGHNQYFFCLAIYSVMGIVCLNIGYLFNINIARKVSDTMLSYKAIIIWAVIFLFFGILRIFGIIS